IVALLFLIVIAANGLALYIPLMTGEMIEFLRNAGMASTDSPFLQIGLRMLFVSIVVWVLTAIQNSIIVIIGQKLTYALRIDVYEHLMHLPISYTDTHNTGNVLSIVISDINNVSDTISTDLVTLLAGIISVFGSLGMMLSLSPELTLIFAFTIPLMIFVTKLIATNARKYHRKRKTMYGILSGFVEEILTAQKSSIIYNTESDNIRDFDEYSDKLRDYGIKASAVSSLMMPAASTINNLNFSLICIIGTLLVIADRMTLGAISAFILFSKKFSGPIVDSSDIIASFQSTFASCDRIFTILSQEIEEPVASTTTKLEKFKGKIEFRNVSFSYNEADVVLKNISFIIQPHQKIALVGATGSGKTTIISLLLRFYKEQEGQILIDDKDINTYPLKELRRHFGLITQNSWIFQGTIMSNLSYALREEEIDRKEIIRLCSQIQVDEFIGSLTNHYDTVLKSDSGGLSDGQVELINIARAFVANPDIFILDEATASIDPQTEQKIQKTTDAVLKDKTSIIIAHRLNTIKSADCIFVLKEGQIIERGTHDSLLKAQGYYKEIYQSK
ncbi:MAG TPA: ABC transporter ATP-binding protein, partial [Sphaerochaeta sp.]|nr:ABC transporter ATP-binding protein [Sphaerochaeta sp.]